MMVNRLVCNMMQMICKFKGTPIYCQSFGKLDSFKFETFWRQKQKNR